jgi:hypothetical protein
VAETVEVERRAGRPWWARWLALQVATLVGAVVAWVIGGGRTNPVSVGELVRLLLVSGLLGSALWAVALRRWSATVVVAVAHVGWIAMLARAEARLYDPGITPLVWFPVASVFSGAIAWAIAATVRSVTQPREDEPTG